MNDFVMNLWHELREKRLLPVALALVVGLVAVPVLLAKPAPDEDASSSVPAPVASPASKQAQAALVALADDDAAGGSGLRLFDPRDPFSPEGVKNLQSVSSTEIAKAADDLVAATEKAEEASAGGGGGTGDAGGGTVGGAPGDTGGGDGSGGGTKTTQFTYVIDVTFTSNGRTRRLRGLDKLSMLPSENSPLLLFLGVDSGGDDAVFLVDSTLDAEGEGRCSPSPSDCATLSLGPGSEHSFTNDAGDSYTLRVEEIRKVKLARASAGSSRRARVAAQERDADDATEGVTARPVRRFVPPILADLVTVASPATDDSSTDKDRR
jgi:hypothetical protein